MVNIKLGAVIVFAIVAVTSTNAIATTGFYKGQTAGGMDKICFYDVLGEQHTINVPSYAICPLTYEFNVAPAYGSPSASPPMRSGHIGFFKYEEDQGLAKICYYDVLGDTQAVTLNAVSICPSTYNF
jgi:hypothetical protein